MAGCFHQCDNLSEMNIRTGTFPEKVVDILENAALEGVSIPSHESLTFKKGQEMFYRGQSAVGLYVLASGMVRNLEHEGGPGKGLGRVLHPPALLNPESLPQATVHATGAVALTEVSVYFIASPHVRSWLKFLEAPHG